MNKDELYIEVGKIIELIQKFENEFKLLTIKYNIEKSDDKRSLSNMSSFLLRNSIVNEKEYLIIKKVIEERNYIIHKLFISENIQDYRLNDIKETINNALNIFKSK